MNETIGSRIRWARKRIGRSLVATAHQAGIAYSTMWNAEHDATNLTISKLMQVATALEVGVDFLATGANPPGEYVAQKPMANGIPPELSELAAELNLRFRMVLDLARMARLAQGQMSKEAWQQLYECARLMADERYP